MCNDAGIWFDFLAWKRIERKLDEQQQHSIGSNGGLALQSSIRVYTLEWSEEFGEDKSTSWLAAGHWAANFVIGIILVCEYVTLVRQTKLECTVCARPDGLARTAIACESVTTSKANRSGHVDVASVRAWLCETFFFLLLSVYVCSFHFLFVDVPAV